jgi:hypothetical protein
MTSWPKMNIAASNKYYNTRTRVQGPIMITITAIKIGTIHLINKQDDMLDTYHK